MALHAVIIMAKKSKGFRDLLKQETKAIAQEKSLDEFSQRFQQSKMGNQFAGVLKNPKGEIKMSEVLENFVEPYLAEARGPEQQQMLFKMAVIAWNSAIMPETERQSALNNLLKMMKVKKSDRQEVEGLLDELVVRKLELFPDNHRYIVDFQLDDAGDQFHLSVASTSTPTSQ